VVWLTEKPNLSASLDSCWISVPFPTPEGPQMTSEDGDRRSPSLGCTGSAGVDCSAPIFAAGCDVPAPA
jgi:hypothetical protein